MTGPRDDDARARESRAILNRIRQETEPQIGAHTVSVFSRTRAHFAARDVDADDRLEVIGTRIGRALSLVGFVVLAGLLAYQLSGD